jgi:hypothetical protein
MRAFVEGMRKSQKGRCGHKISGIVCKTRDVYACQTAGHLQHRRQENTDEKETRQKAAIEIESVKLFPKAIQCMGLFMSCLNLHRHRHFPNTVSNDPGLFLEIIDNAKPSSTGFGDPLF